MLQCPSVDSHYGVETGRDIVLGFLCNQRYLARAGGQVVRSNSASAREADMSKQVSVSIPELDDLFAEGMPAKGAPAQDLEISLDELLAESLEQAREEKEAKAVAERRKRGGTLSEEDLVRIRAQPSTSGRRANVALFDKTTCNGCGRQQTIFYSSAANGRNTDTSKALDCGRVRGSGSCRMKWR